MDSGARLKAERNRLGMSQEAFGGACGVAKNAQVNYEAGKRRPDSDYLAAAARLGADVLYIVTGVSSPAGAIEQQLLERFRAATPELQRASLAVLGVTAVAQPAAPSFVGAAGDNHGQIVQGGTLQQDHVSFNVGPKKRGSRKA